MPSQNNSGLQYNKLHALTVTLIAAVLANRFVAYDGGYATSAAGVKDAQGVSESSGEIGEAIPVVTGYSFPVELGADVTFGAYVKPGTDGKAIPGTFDDHCGRALGGGTTGQLVEVQIVTHRHPDA